MRFAFGLGADTVWLLNAQSDVLSGAAEPDVYMRATDDGLERITDASIPRETDGAIA